MIKFDAKTQIVISDDIKSDIWNLLQEEGAINVVMLVDENVVKYDPLIEMKNYLSNKAKLSTHVITSKEPTTDMVNEFTSCLRGEKIDMFIGIGGGSIIDLTKALSVMVVNGGRVEDYHGTGKKFSSGVKKIMIPTTAGTGSEVTPGAVLINSHKKFKRSIGGKYVTPDYAVLNAEFTSSMPENIAASTGMDALGHAIESFTARNANSITRMYSREAFSLIVNNLQKALRDKQDTVARQNVLLGSCLAGYAIYNSNTGAAHSMSYPLGIYNNIPHGIAVAHLLPTVVRINVEKGCFLYAELYDLIANVRSREGNERKSELFVSFLEDFEPLRYIDKTIQDYGVNLNNCEFLAERGLDLKPALNNNPVEFGLNDAKRALKELL